MQAHRDFTTSRHDSMEISRGEASSAKAASAGAQAAARTCEHRQLIMRRTVLEAKLLAWRSGWIELDEFRIRKLRRELNKVLADLPAEDPLARSLMAD